MGWDGLGFEGEAVCFRWLLLMLLLVHGSWFMAHTACCCCRKTEMIGIVMIWVGWIVRSGLVVTEVEEEEEMEGYWRDEFGGCVGCIYHGYISSMKRQVDGCVFLFLFE